MLEMKNEKKTTWVFLYIKYGKCWSVSLKHFKVECKPPFSEECFIIISMTINTSIYFIFYFAHHFFVVSCIMFSGLDNQYHRQRFIFLFPDNFKFFCYASQFTLLKKSKRRVCLTFRFMYICNFLYFFAYTA